jgi:hypothetical protein
MPTQQTQITPAKQSLAVSDLSALLGPPALLEGEDRVAYEELSSRFYAAVAPLDVIEEMWVRDIVEVTSETLRLRRLKATLMQASAHEGLAKVLQPLVPVLDLRDLVIGWSQRDPAATKKVDEVLKRSGLDQLAISAQTLAVRLETFDRIDLMITRTETRRNLILREIDRRRDILARRLREVSGEIEAEAGHSGKLVPEAIE